MGIESSCDETACALVEDGRKVLSNVIDSQIELHRLYGGVVPELAGRNHVVAIDRAAKQAVKDAGADFSDVDAVAVTRGAGLVGCLLVGVSYAKALAYSLGVPLVAVNHIEAHMCANYLDTDASRPTSACWRAEGTRRWCTLWATTIIASFPPRWTTPRAKPSTRLLALSDLPYPGGPQIDRLSTSGKPVFDLPSPLL